VLEGANTFPGISVDDLDRARAFYGGRLGLQLKEQMGGLVATLPDGRELWIYAKPDHQPATFTVLNFVVDDLEGTVDALNAAGVATRIYDDLPYPADERGIVRGRAAGFGPDIAWFTDPAGNVLAVLDRG